ncbi:hypothetical protein BV455_02428 [Parageobacillus caldoxylosilyticus]|nr:hypothetical protein BV455_02428 [Parageobacillus caldoxylosilyticus]
MGKEEEYCLNTVFLFLFAIYTVIYWLEGYRQEFCVM